MKHAAMWVLAATLAAVAAATAPAQETRPPVGIEDLKTLCKETPILVLFQAETVQGNPTVSPRLTWEIKGPVIEVLKGNLLPGKISLHVDSVVRVFDMKKSDVEGKQFVAAIKPLSEAGDRRFQLVGPYAFPADGKEAEALRTLAQSDAQTGSGGQTLELTVRPIDKVFSLSGSKTIEVCLTNKGADTATYLQTPLAEKDGKLYLTGQGKLTVLDTTGRPVRDKGAIVLGQVPPPPPQPAFILSGANFKHNIDLSKYFELPQGRYTMVLALATPDGRGRIPSNAFSFQVGATNPAEPPLSARVEPVKLPEDQPPPQKPAKPHAEKPPLEPVFERPLPPIERPAAPAVNVPDPAKYTPGKTVAGLAGLLRPSKARYNLGDPVDLELRLINVGPRTLAVDARLERTLTIQVQPVADSPDPRQIDQIIAWSSGLALPEERAYLREGAFWGQLININVLPLRPQEKYVGPTTEEIAASKNLTYERFAKSLFSFPKPGYYNVTATYTVVRPKPPEGQPAADVSKEWWIGDLQTNTITLQVGEPGK